MSAVNRETLLNQRRRAFAKRTNLLNEEYKRHARLLLDSNSMIVIEDLNSNSMRDESDKKTKQSKGLNKKLATVKPATMRDFIIQRANKTGKTVVLVNPKFTSQIEFGVIHEPKKIPLEIREWVSEFTERLIKRDYNAAWNILFWGLYPMFHYLALKGESVKTLSRTN
jgi:putative transposase